MKHATPAALVQIEPLLGRLRAFAKIQERRPGVFYLRSRAFLHFHEDPAGLFADIRAPGADDFTRLKVDDGAALVAMVSQAVGER